MAKLLAVLFFVLTACGGSQQVETPEPEGPHCAWLTVLTPDGAPYSVSKTTYCYSTYTECEVIRQLADAWLELQYEYEPTQCVEEGWWFSSSCKPDVRTDRQ